MPFLPLLLSSYTYIPPFCRITQEICAGLVITNSEQKRERPTFFHFTPQCDTIGLDCPTSKYSLRS